MSAIPRRGAAVAGVPAVPLVLVVGCSERFVAACREAGARLAVAVRECDLGSIRAAAAGQPFAIVVTEDLYRFDPAAFDAMARGAGSSLIRIDARDADDADARRLLVEAVFESAATLSGSGVRPAVG